MTKQDIKGLCIGETVEFNGERGTVVATRYNAVKVRFEDESVTLVQGGDLESLTVIRRGTGLASEAEADVVAASEAIDDADLPSDGQDVGAVIATHFANGGKVEDVTKILGHDGLPEERTGALSESEMAAYRASFSGPEAGEVVYATKPDGSACYVTVSYKSAKAKPTYATRLETPAASTVSGTFPTSLGVTAKNGWTINPACKGAAWIEALRPKAEAVA